MNAESHVYARVTRRFDASPERVFDAWLNPEMIGRWMFGPAIREEEVVKIAADARVGGTFSFVVRRQGVEIDHIGEYLEIDRPRRLVFTWAVAPDPIDSSRVMVDIVPQGSGCELTLTHQLAPDWADYRSRTEDAWTKMLDSLAATLG
ncbi:SRPBCC domain-containing protein [Brevibacillus sp. WF146]|uniref:SRPBCC family protein n=1 Tax=Brevibacillus sp. WF146 TaxID=319501 RepID=UPI0007ECCB15|nr:SRPBCC family protein [Brevibacillus sp. WF146]UYZ15251.1 SRPBCC domain-containing protein [Brevibacillus sp. WF146]